MRKLYPCLLALMFLIGCQPDEQPLPVDDLDTELREAIRAAHSDGADHFMLPDPNDLSAVPADPNNPLTQAKVHLGKLLFHEPLLGIEARDVAGRQSYSCASCHHAAAGFQAGRVQGIGEGGSGFGQRGEARIANPEYVSVNLDVQPIRSPSILNTAYQEVMLWNGALGGVGINAGTESQWSAGSNEENNHLGFEGVETQAIAGMKVHRLDCDLQEMSTAGYGELFDAAFPEVPVPDRYDRTRAALAMAAYERTVLPNRAPWQQYLRGDDSAMSLAEKRGAALFLGKANCTTCHTGPALSSMSFHAIGMGNISDVPEEVFLVPTDPIQNLGRGGFTQNSLEYYRFKTPQLYNLVDSPFYGHGGTFRNLRDVIRYKNEAVPENPEVPEVRLSPLFRPLELSEAEIDDLVAFLRTGLYDAELERYVPESLPSGNCFPNNDPISRVDVGCE